MGIELESIESLRQTATRDENNCTGERGEEEECQLNFRLIKSPSCNNFLVIATSKQVKTQLKLEFMQMN